MSDNNPNADKDFEQDVEHDDCPVRGSHCFCYYNDGDPCCYCDKHPKDEENE